jgi:ABC-2 type transport system permease protein
VTTLELAGLRGFSFKRVGAVMLRQAFLYKRTFHRWVDIIYWPTIDLLLWGFITLYLQRRPSGISNPAAFFLGALILWDILFRAQQSVSVGFLEDVWSRNLLNMFATPIRPLEYLAGSVATGAIRVVIGAGIAIVLALAFYDFNFFSIGLPLIPFLLNLAAMGWAIGILTTAVILRFGEGAEVLAWALAFLFQPISAVFYPVAVLPIGLEVVAHAVPASHVFQGMRQVIAGGAFPSRELMWATALNVIYLVVSWMFFRWTFAIVRERGLLARFGE